MILRPLNRRDSSSLTTPSAGLLSPLSGALGFPAFHRDRRRWMGDGAISHPLLVHDRLSSSRNIDAQLYQDKGRAEHGVSPRVVRGHVPCDVIWCPTESYSRFTFESGTIWCHAPPLLCATSG